jgi:hypothetical protein
MRHLIAGLALTLVVTGAARADQIVVNGGFETGDFTGWSQSGAPGSSLVTKSAPHSGMYAAYLDANGVGSLSQTLVTTPGDALHVSFWLKVNGDEGSGKNKGPQSSIQVQLGSTTLFSATDLSPGNYKQYTFDTTATGSSTNLVFTFSNQHNFFHLDDVSIDRTGGRIGPASANPEPASLTLAAVGLFGVAVVARCRRNPRRLGAAVLPGA